MEGNVNSSRTVGRMMRKVMLSTKDIVNERIHPFE